MGTVFFYASKIISHLIFPFPVFFIATLLAGRSIRRPLYRRLFGVLWVALYVLSIDFGSDALMSSLENRYDYVPVQEAPPADAVVVLGGMVNPLAAPTDRPEFLGTVDRILAGMDLLDTGRYPYLVITGGSGLLGQQGKPEARILEEWVLEHGVNGQQLLIEAESRNTAENAAFTHRLLQKQKDGSPKQPDILLVTSAFHMPRSVAVFEKAGFTVHPFPVDYNTTEGTPFPEGYFPTPANLLHSTYAIKEFIGMIAYRAMGYL